MIVVVVVVIIACHQLVDPEQYYRDCVYDMCACQVKLGECLCPTIASYAKECAQKGVIVDWIPDVRECGNFLRWPKGRYLDSLYCV